MLDVDEISLPLISLGLSTDTGFVEKLIKALKSKKKKTKKEVPENSKKSQSSLPDADASQGGEDN